MRRSFEFRTVDVFTDQRFGGNPLAVFTDAHGLSTSEMQAVAAELNLSETAFVLPPGDGAHTARVRIFSRSSEMGFAGHPNVGTGFILAASAGTAKDVMLFEQEAGLVEVRIIRGPSGLALGAEIDAPQPLRVLEELEVAAVAACGGLSPEQLRTATHRPVRAETGMEYVLAEVAPESLSSAAPDITAFRKLAVTVGAAGNRLTLLLYAREGDKVRSRVFAPLSGTWEDPATGGAHATLAALLLARSGGEHLRLEVRQGEEMGRPSRMEATARASVEGIIRASVGGACVPVTAGLLTL